MGAPAHPLQRFVDAQAPVIEAVYEELTDGRKRTHWMWFVFPQLKGLGRSPTAEYFGLASRDEALAYWRHPVLGLRLAHCARLALAAPGASAREIFGTPDDLKLHSCMTLFAAVVPEEPVFGQVLARFFESRADERTLALLGD